MKILLVAVNAKFIQTNLAVRLLKGYADEKSEAVAAGRLQIEIAEWNINQPVSAIVRGVFESRPDVVLFSTYIWNRDIVFSAALEIRKVLPLAMTGFGGPEVSWSPEKAFTDCQAADFIISGEGERTFLEIGERIASGGNAPHARDISDITGVHTRTGFGGDRPLIESLDEIPFPYTAERMDFDPVNRIVYYESSRGCPFSCAYCLSSIERSVRYYSLDRVLGDLSYFMDAGFPLVKFVDRTFNLDPKRYLAIWKFIRDNHNGKTLFHFEIAAELLSDEAFGLLETMPSGAVQFEIGIQSINAETLKVVGRQSTPSLLAEKIRRVPRTIHTHVDLIAGLPLEDRASFARSFDFAFALDADMLQLGFLKILAGSPMHSIALNNPGYEWSDRPPYEVLATPALPFGDMLEIKDVEYVTDVWYNSALMRNTLNYLVTSGARPSAFALFYELANFIRSYYPDGDLFLPRRVSDSFECMAAFLLRNKIGSGDYLKYDYFLLGKPGVFPKWFERRYSKEEHNQALIERGLLGNNGESRRIVYSQTEYERFFFPGDEGEKKILFMYTEGSHREKKAKSVFL
jgi:radical SAM superfamily enzyme YgiQ (UPF0313 family)